MKTLRFTVQPGGVLQGKIRVPGDKSISHRSIMLGSLADGITEVAGFLEGEDSIATLQAFQAMGVEIHGPKAGKVTIHGVGINGLTAPKNPIDVGNSGTSMRLMAGLLAGQKFNTKLLGDASLNKRPMGRVINPLAEMGAEVGSQNGMPPLEIKGGADLKAIEYALPMASAQVKSCILLAGLYAKGTTKVIEPEPTRDHTERMLRGFGYQVESKQLSEQATEITIQGGGRLTACEIDIPADISSAAFYMVAASIAKGSDLTLEHVGINPTRTGIIDILKLMGANIELLNQREVGGEPVADIRVKSAQLKGIQIPEYLVPLAIDEFPVLFVAASAAEGQTVLTGAAELRVKESDRIQVMADALQAVGIDAQPTADGMIINPGKQTPQNKPIISHHDHRIAMSMVVAGLTAVAPIEIDGCETVNTSFPKFVELANSVGLTVSASEV